jgi:hypothetical protein
VPLRQSPIMKRSNSIIVITVFVVIELIVGTLVGRYYIYNYLSRSNGNKDLMLSIVNFYMTLNLLFFGLTIALGIISIWILKKWERLYISILFSAAFGFIFLIAYAMAFSFLSYVLNIRQIPLFFTLLGFILGFNFGILKKKKTQINKFP